MWNAWLVLLLVFAMYKRVLIVITWTGYYSSLLRVLIYIYTIKYLM